MNVFIMTDLEGVSGIDSMEKIQPEGADFDWCRHRMMCDVNAAIEGAVRGGARNIYTVEGHYNAFCPEELDPRATLVSLREWEDVIRSGEVDVYMEVGAHAMAGTEKAFLDHTFSSLRWYNYIVNGKKLGEVETNALFVGAFGIPVVMVSGDAAVCREARTFLGNIETAVVKTATERNRAVCLPPAEAVSAIRNAAEKAMSVKNKPFQMPFPLSLRLELYRSDYCDEVTKRLSGKVERVDARCVERMLDSIESYGEITFLE
ncbi:MAG: M55 family metallopeptidase [Clostridia bacterium]|nr:M55 family metallopeptidase [Clostridia bacterium]